MRNSWRLLRKGLSRALPMILFGVVGFILANSIVTETPLKVATAVGGVVVGALVANWIEIGIIAALVLCTSFMHTSALPAPFLVGGQGFGFAELLIGFMTAQVVLRTLAHKRMDIIVSPVTLPLVILGVSGLLSMVVAYRSHSLDPRRDYDFTHSYNTVRDLFPYILTIVIGFGIRTRRSLTIILVAALIIASIISLMMAAQFVVGSGTKLFLGGTYGTSRVEEMSKTETDVTRSLPPGLGLIQMVWLPAIYMACVSRKRRLFYGLASVLIGIGILFSFTRGCWTTMILGLFIVWLAANRDVKRRLILAVPVCALAITLAVVGIGEIAPAGTRQHMANAFSTRWDSIFEKDTLSSSSLQNRFRENRYAWSQVKDHPIFGIGAGTPVGYFEVQAPRHAIYPRQQIHNSYLEVWMVYGLLGLIAIAWLSVVFLIRCTLLYRNAHDELFKALALGLAAAFIAHMLRAATQMSLMHENFSIVSVALTWGMVEVAIRLNGQQQAAEQAGSERSVAVATARTR